MDGDMIHIVGNDSIDLPSLAYDALFSKHSLYVDQYVSLHAAMGGNFEFLHHSWRRRTGATNENQLLSRLRQPLATLS